eukprot:gene15244-16818_t
MRLFYAYLLLWFSYGHVTQGDNNNNSNINKVEPSRHIYSPGDVILGGMFTLHVRSSEERIVLVTRPVTQQNSNTCRGTFSRRAFQSLHGMLMAVQQINANKQLLPGIKIGVDIRDTCDSVDFAVKESLNFSFVRKYFKGPTLCEVDKADTKRDKADKKTGQVDSKTDKSDTKTDKGDTKTDKGDTKTDKIKDKTKGKKKKDNDKDKNIDTKSMKNKQGETVAIIGPDFSEIARAVSDLAGLFNVPVVSPSATSDFLGDRKRFRHFFRTVPPDTYQTRVIANLLTHFKWNYVVLLSSDDEYGRSGRSALKQRMKDTSPSICTVIDEVITPQKIPQIIRVIKAERKARVIILYSVAAYVLQVMKESTLQRLYGYTWIASDGWSEDEMVIHGNERLLQGMLGVGTIPSYIPKFKEELAKIATNGSKENIWHDEFQANEKQSCSRKDLAQCILDEDYKISPYVGTTIDAVYAVAKALHDVLQCTKVSCKMGKKDIKRSRFLESLKNVKFIGASGREISFDWFGSGLSSFQIMNLKRTKHGHSFVPVAEWRYLDHDVNISKRFTWVSDITWNNGGSIPTSTCSNDCMAGQRRRPRKTDPQCCWTCVACGGNTIPNATNKYTCSKCRTDFWPNTEHTQCLTIKKVYLDWNNVAILVILVFSCIGLAMVIFTGCVFVKYRSTPVVKAASRGLCYLLLVGVSLFYLLPFSMIGEPNHARCKAIPFMLGFCLSLNVGTMLMKTNRIARIFSKQIMRRNTRFLSSQWQYFMVFIMVAVEEAICLIWILALNPPHVSSEFFIDQVSRVYTCSFSDSNKGLGIWSFYNAGLILVCTYQAFLVRKVPHNYNEAKFIAFTMISICITILVYVPVHVGDVSYSKDIICCFLYTFVATVEFACIFAPKLYIILFRPSKNVEMQISDPSTEQRSIRQRTTELSEFRKCHSNMNGSKKRRLTPSAAPSEAVIFDEPRMDATLKRKGAKIFFRRKSSKRNNRRSRHNDIVEKSTGSEGGKINSASEIFEEKKKEEYVGNLFANTTSLDSSYCNTSDSNSTILSTVENDSSSEMGLDGECESKHKSKENHLKMKRYDSSSLDNVNVYVAETQSIDGLVNGKAAQVHGNGGAKGRSMSSGWEDCKTMKLSQRNGKMVDDDRGNHLKSEEDWEWEKKTKRREDLIKERRFDGF